MKGYEGSAITAIHHGRIVFSDWLRGFGLLLIVDHGDGYLSLYFELRHNGKQQDTAAWLKR